MFRMRIKYESVHRLSSGLRLILQSRRLRESMHLKEEVKFQYNHNVFILNLQCAIGRPISSIEK